MLEFLVALGTTSVAMFPLLALLRQHQVMDVPNVRSSHATIVPRGGGIAVLTGVAAGAVSALLVENERSAPHRGVLLVVVLGVLMFAALGFSDDVRGLPATVRLTLQVVIASALSVTIAVGMPSSWEAAFVAVVGTIWLTSYVNAFNFMDGINAISAMSALLAACWFGGLAAHASDTFVYVASWTLAGASLAFLPWNAPRARVFLGDVGSYGIGALIGVLALLTALREQDIWVAVAPLVIYLVDTSGTLALRVLRGEPLLDAHRSHVYQRLTDTGLSHMRSALVVCGFTAAVLLATLLLPTPSALSVGIAVSLCYLCLPVALARRAR